MKRTNYKDKQTCPKCGSINTRIVGGSLGGEEPCCILMCDDCNYTKDLVAH